MILSFAIGVGTTKLKKTHTKKHNYGKIEFPQVKCEAYVIFNILLFTDKIFNIYTHDSGA